jgi:DNA-binding transcriptional ArsR family regulator
MTPEKDTYVELKRLSSDNEYFINVFKRVEKLLSVVFYVLSHTETTKSDFDTVSYIKDTAFSVHETSLSVLRLPLGNSATGLEELQHELTCLLSTLKVGEAASLMPKNICVLIYEQIDLAQRYIGNHFLVSRTRGIELAVEQILQERTIHKKLHEGGQVRASSGNAAVRKKHVRIPEGDISSDAYFVYSQLTDRAQRIQTVLEAKPQATIKDIAEIITDVSEKTIQRELNSLIEKGQVRREGERRWSKYSVNK